MIIRVVKVPVPPNKLQRELVMLAEAWKTPRVGSAASEGEMEIASKLRTEVTPLFRHETIFFSLCFDERCFRVTSTKLLTVE